MDCSARVKSNLIDRNLWSVIESTTQPPNERDNFKALQVIWNSCGDEVFSKIYHISSAQSAWNTLLEICGTPNDTSTVDQREDDIINLSEDNYTNWSTQLKSDLEAKDLWSVIISTSDPPRQEDGEDTLMKWREKNLKALHVILDSCGWRAFSKVQGIYSAKIAWNTLARIYHISCNTDTAGELVKAVQRGDRDATKRFLELHPDVVNKRITVEGETALHIAVVAGHVHIVEELVELMSKENLEVQNISGSTAFIVAVGHGNCQMAKCMHHKNTNLVGIEINGKLPLTEAIICGHEELSRYLYSVTPHEILVRGDAMAGALVCTQAILAQMWDIELDLIRRHRFLAFALDKNKFSPVLSLALPPWSLTRANQLSFWKRWIYSCMHITLADAPEETRLNIQTSEVYANGSVEVLFHQLLSHLPGLLGLKHLYEIKLAHLRYQKILDYICEEIPNLNRVQRVRGGVGQAIFCAIKNGNFKFVYKIVRRNPDVLGSRDDKDRNIFMVAVQYRQAEIFSLIYGLREKNFIVASYDKSKNFILHVAGELAPSSELNRLPGAALQMQRELQWFKEVESISFPSHKQLLNIQGLTPKELFTESHENLRKEGEKWMKDTATSCTVVGALITTIMFAAIFTVPGGNNQDLGMPIFLHEKLFMLFIISDSLSLFFSSTSLLMFMGILTSRYAEEDFLKSLPKRMIIGLSTLFISIATMMITFCAAVLLMLREQSWTPIPLICLASIPVCLFGLNQFSLLVDMFNSTYGPSIFNREMKPWF